MATKFYPLAKVHFAKGDILWKAAGGNTIRAFLINTANYTYSDAHEFLSSVPTNARVGAAGGTARANGIQLTLIDPASGGILNANNIVFNAIPGTVVYSAVLIFKDDGTADSSSPLIMYIDNATGLPVTSNGNDINCAWGTGPNLIGTL